MPTCTAPAPSADRNEWMSASGGATPGASERVPASGSGKAVAGDVLALAGPVTVRVDAQAPQDARIDLLKDGTPVTAGFSIAPAGNPTQIVATLTGVTVSGSADFVLKGSVDNIVIGDEITFSLAGNASGIQAAGAIGWDWCGLNLEDSGSLMAFRMRDKDGKTRFAPPGVSFEPLRTWKSPRTGVEYPVAMKIRTKDGEWRLEPLMDDQELDARASTGAIYWEGAVTAYGDRTPAHRTAVGRGYLELTGYWRPMKL